MSCAVEVRNGKTRELPLHFAVKVVIFRVNVTFCVDCYILRRNTQPKHIGHETKVLTELTDIRPS